MGRREVYLFKFAALLSEISGTAIKATTAGRRAVKAAETYLFSLKFSKKIAINKIITKEGTAVPIAATILPLVPFTLFPTNIAILIASMPGADCEMAR